MGGGANCSRTSDIVFRAKHPRRLIRGIVNEVPAALDGEFTRRCTDGTRPSIAPKRRLRARLLQAFYTIRSDRE
jgi:hypothetical protein